MTPVASLPAARAASVVDAGRLASGGATIAAPNALGVPFRSLLATRKRFDGSDTAPSVQSNTRPLAYGRGQPIAADAAQTRRARHGARDDDAVDPIHRQRAADAFPMALSGPGLGATTHAAVPSPPSITAAAAAVSLEHLLPALVRRIAWSGDGCRGSARVEIGAGPLAGATLVVHADGGRVRVHLDVPPGIDAASWRARISRRLASRRIEAEVLEVT